MSNDIILDVKNLNVTMVSDHTKVRIVKDVSLQLQRGKTLAIVGESGCGKSVTVHSIMRLTPKSTIIASDHVIYRSRKQGVEKEYRLDQMKNNGRAMRKIRGAEISMVFQDPMASLNPVYRVGDQICEGLLEHNPKLKKRDAWAMATDMLRNLGLPAPEQRMKDYPHQLSGGMKQRVVIAIAMICNPEILIADEPTTALDVTIQAQIMELMKRLQTEMGKSLILITHNMGLVAEMADDVAVMYMGRIVEYGSITDIFNSPAHPYTRALLKSVPVLGMAKEAELVNIPGNTPNPADLTEGCEFADRCAEAMPCCRKGEIPSCELLPGHWVRCMQYVRRQEEPCHE